MHVFGHGMEWNGDTKPNFRTSEQEEGNIERLTVEGG
jgi:hypothetical protein